jgi:hypothetical protein
MYIVLTYNKFINLDTHNKPAIGMKTTRIGIKLRTYQGKQITKNASLNLIQN